MPTGTRYGWPKNVQRDALRLIKICLKGDTLSTGETRPVLAVIPVDTNGDIHLHNANGTLDVVADLEGYIG